MKMLDCQKVQEKSIDYINRRLTQEECSEIAVHLMSCHQCREDVAFLITLKKGVSQLSPEIPQNLYHTAFDKISGKASAFGLGTYLKPIQDSLQTAGQVIKFSYRLIQEV